MAAEASTVSPTWGMRRSHEQAAHKSILLSINRLRSTYFVDEGPLSASVASDPVIDHLFLFLLLLMLDSHGITVSRRFGILGVVVVAEWADQCHLGDTTGQLSECFSLH